MLANDSFTDADATPLGSHVSDSGHTWTLGTSVFGQLYINASNELANTFSSLSWYYTSATPETAEYDIQCDISGSGSTGGPNGRHSTSANTRYFVIYNSGAAQWELTKIVAGAKTILGTYAGDAPTSPRTVLLQIRDATKKVFIDGAERISSTDNAITAAGRAGVEGSTVNTDTLDNWSSTDVSTLFPPFRHRIQHY